MEIVVSNKTRRPLYEQIATQVKTQIMSGELKAREALPSIRSLAKSLQISVLTVQKAYDLLQTDGFMETTAGKGCYVHDKKMNAGGALYEFMINRIIGIIFQIPALIILEFVV